MMKQNMKRKWSNKDITTLIDAYKKETCLYAVHSPHYHNKLLRSAAMKRVGDAVRVVRPDATDKECASKFHTLRTQYNVENSKVKLSMKLSTVTDDVYQPSLWYFDHLKFLNAYITPRKSRNSTGRIAELSTQTQDTQDSVRIVCSEFSDDGQFDVYIEENDDNPPPPPSPQLRAQSRAQSPPLPPPQSSPPSDGSEQGPSTSTPAYHGPSPARPSPSCSPDTCSSSSSGVFCRRKRRASASSQDSYTGAIKSLADALRQPVVVQTTSSHTAINATPICDDVISSYLAFLGSLIRSIESKKLRLTLMSKLTEVAINSCILDLSHETP